ncbi:hypothetical protein AGABI1DRAFT_132509 [Agaricus bisporus var. burnettii JB137-S8]|uniref:Beta-hexosaminidase n=1 Tax=Agaricus bisporus var. burnettii (strain JB137-S8 / ATCC MYA-4627 / FGSC 10392) TaxID=597362 RepID=K5VLA4_AGABU|nr:uncharacterized protein AGABI1DRAFT_132509 [Agaricus bisporus var. burnettii JB137-S8]EKM75154.1 hypothetical protein AGABI1DRAFT_132509 [Agaricus bisporus var. burnettii JB137-S8]
MTSGTKPLRLSPKFTIKFSQKVTKDISDAAQRTTKFLKTDRLRALVPDRGASLSGVLHSANVLHTLTVNLTPSNGVITSLSEEVMKGIGAQDESYWLEVPADGNTAFLSANTALGVFRGLTTFEQLWYDLDGVVYTTQAPVQIEDAPAYPYRGFMLDTSRNFFPVEDIKRTLDAMSWVKINHFHWHVVDSQSFPLVVPRFEEISSKGAYSSAEVYMPQDVKDIVEYAAARGIDVMVEIDIPGHTAVISKSYPLHVACPEATPWSHFANEPPAGQLRITSPSTVSFTTDLIRAVSSMFPSKLFSTGGDEVNMNCYKKDWLTQRDLGAQGKNIEQALDSFTQVTHSVLTKAGKTPVVWEEMVLEHQPRLSNDTIVLVWISSSHAKKVAKKGHRLIHAASDYFYLDCGGGGWMGNHINGNSWCDPFKTWQKAYSFNPTEGLQSYQRNLVLGGQQLLWAEQAGPSNLDSIVWPRAAASAEVFWSGPGGDVNNALPRLHDIAYRFIQRGVKAIPLQPHWCALRPGACNMDPRLKFLMRIRDLVRTNAGIDLAFDLPWELLGIPKVENLVHLVCPFCIPLLAMGIVTLYGRWNSPPEVAAETDDLDLFFS